MTSGIVPYSGGKGDAPAGVREQLQWYEALSKGIDPTVLPEQAFAVTRILDGIYTSARTGKPFFFD